MEHAVLVYWCMNESEGHFILDVIRRCGPVYGRGQLLNTLGSKSISFRYAFALLTAVVFEILTAKRDHHPSSCIIFWDIHIWE